MFSETYLSHCKSHLLVRNDLKTTRTQLVFTSKSRALFLTMHIDISPQPFFKAILYCHALFHITLITFKHGLICGPSPPQPYAVSWQLAAIKTASALVFYVHPGGLICSFLDTLNIYLHKSYHIIGPKLAIYTKNGKFIHKTSLILISTFTCETTPNILGHFVNSVWSCSSLFSPFPEQTNTLTDILNWSTLQKV